MNFFLSGFLEALVLVTALSVDAFVASFAYGTNRVKIPISSMAVMDLISAGILLIFLLIGSLLVPMIPSGFVRIFCFAVLFGLGMIKIFDSYIKTLIRKRGTCPRDFVFFLEFCFILKIYADPDKADADKSGVLSVKEAVSLGTALSLDSAAAGVRSGCHDHEPSSDVCDVTCNRGRCNPWRKSAGKPPGGKLSLNLSWISGFLLMALAFMKFL